MLVLCFVFFFKQKTAYEMRISDWSSDVCSSDLDPRAEEPPVVATEDEVAVRDLADLGGRAAVARVGGDRERLRRDDRLEPALLGPPLVVVERVRVVHRLHPPAEVV